MNRIASLDSLRGIAALVVLAGHMAAVYPGFLEAMHDVPVLPLPLAGSVAVYVFFVLSGLVLYATFAGVDRFAYAPYAAKRLFRILPPLAAAVAGSALLCAALGPPPATGFSAWFAGSTWSVPPSPRLVLRHLALLDTPADQTLDPVMWSLVHEMRMSLVFPAIALAVRWRAAATLAAALAVSLAARRLAFSHAAPWPVDPFATLQYAALFAAGAALAARGDRIAPWLARPRVAAAAFAGALALASVQPRWAAGLATSAGAAGIVACCYLSPGIARALDRRPLLWLGRVSYALYLVHLPVLHAVVRAGAGTLPLPAALAIAAAASLALAEIAHRAVERPAIRAGRAMAARLARGERAPRAVRI